MQGVQNLGDSTDSGHPKVPRIVVVQLQFKGPKGQAPPEEAGQRAKGLSASGGWPKGQTRRLKRSKSQAPPEATAMQILEVQIVLKLKKTDARRQKNVRFFLGRLTAPTRVQNLSQDNLRKEALCILKFDFSKGQAATGVLKISRKNTNNVL